MAATRERCEHEAEPTIHTGCLCERRTENGRTDDFFLSGQRERPVQPLDIPEGAMLTERFRVVRRLGFGRHGTVFLARDFLRDEDVAVKAIKTGHGESVRAPDHVLKDIHSLSRICDFSHVIKVHDVHEAQWGGGRLLLLSMQLAECSLRDWIVQHRDAPQIRSALAPILAFQICQGISTLFNAGIIPLDIKPENILFVGDRIKIADFCAVIFRYMAGEDDFQRSTLSPREFGTREYMSPEQAVATSYAQMDERATVFCIGVILYELLHPQSALPLCSSPSFPWHAAGVAWSPSPPPGVNGPLGDIVLRCLRPYPKDRFATVALLANALKECFSETPPEESEDEGARPRTSEHEDLWHSACEASHAGQFREAIAFCERLLSLNPGHGGAQQLKEEIEVRRSQASSLYQVLERDLDSVSLDECAYLLQEAVEAFPGHPSGPAIQTRLAIRARRVRETVDRAQDALQNAAWESALSIMRQALALSNGDPEINSAVTGIESLLRTQTETRVNIREALERHDFHKAMALAASLDNLVEGVSRTFLDRRE